MIYDNDQWMSWSMTMTSGCHDLWINCNIKHKCILFLWSFYDFYTRMWTTAKNFDIIHVQCTCTCRYEILHTLNLGCSFITLREPCNKQRPRYDIAWLHVNLQIIYSTVFQVKRLNNLVLHVRLFNRLAWILQ